MSSLVVFADRWTWSLRQSCRASHALQDSMKQHMCAYVGCLNSKLPWWTISSAKCRLALSGNL
eukprot:5659072-Pleurochrysis_carterae.AAC.1